MMRGTVNSRREAIIRLRTRGPTGHELEVNAVVDSGFTSSLTLPASAIASLALVRTSGGQAVLADGSLTQFDLFDAEVQWEGNWRSVVISAVGDEALLGMRLLAKHELRMEVVRGGVVEITPLP